MALDRFCGLVSSWVKLERSGSSSCGFEEPSYHIPDISKIIKLILF